MKNYLSMGFGVNSVALYLLMQDLGMEFEAVYVDHGSDWPETLEYMEMFRQVYPVTVINPEYRGFTSLYQYCKDRRVTPNRMRRWCTDQFKVRPLHAYFEKPCFVHLGIDAGEQHRARISGMVGQENRFILIEEGIDRAGCEQMIREHGLPVPIKSGCYFCPFQRIGQWRLLRREHPDLFCSAIGLERGENESRSERGKRPHYTFGENRPLESLIDEDQQILPGFEIAEYPPCQCGL